VPEGHTIHRLARLHREALLGRRVEATSPQGRFADGAAQLDGRVLEGVEPYGKHLFYRWAPAGTEEESILHVHLGLFGKFRTHRGLTPPPTDGTRLRLRTDEVTIDLAGPTACELLDDDAEAAIRARLGPDLLRSDADPERAWAALRRRASPIGTALLDQKVLAGVGNVYRAEALFVCGIAPETPARELARSDFDCLWSTLRRMLRAGERSGRIVTVVPAEVGVRTTAAVPDAERTYVYRRTGQPCRRCATPIRMSELGNRRMYACPSCQRERR
jgi:endonuclease VIII